MIKVIAIIAGEPNSISSEIIFKSWKLRKQFHHKPLFIIGSVRLLNLQKKKLNFPIKIKEINIEQLKDQSVNAEKTKILQMHSLSHLNNARRSASVKFFQ